MNDVESIDENSNGKQSSIVTIFSIWNTIMGTSLLSMPWAIGQAGLGLGIGLMILMTFITLYTAYRTMKGAQQIASYSAASQTDSFTDTEGGDRVIDYAELCEHYLGRPGKILAVVFSVGVLLGAAIVYWVLMSNFLYNTVAFIHDEVSGQSTTSPPTNGSLLYNDDNKSSRPTNDVDPMAENDFQKYWGLTTTVPFFLMILVVPFINFKSALFFTKFNSFGTISILYLIGFVTYKASLWGFNLDFDIVPGKFASLSFPVLTGMLSLTFFVHNGVLSIIRNQKNPENNARDVSIAFICVSLTCTYVGVMFYAAWPMISKDCIDENLLNNFLPDDLTAFIARIFLLLQLITVFPLLSYIMRVQIMNAIFKSVWPSWKHVVVFNILVVGICLTFATLYPDIGSIIRYTGSFCGLVIIFLIPSVIYILTQKRKGKLNWMKATVHILIIAIGFANFIGQIFV